MVKSILGSFLKSLVGQFIIGGITVAGIAYFSNTLTNAAIAGIIGALPVGMPSSVFVDDSKVEAYAFNLLIMSIPLLIATFSNWFLISKMKFSKYKSVSISMGIYILSSLLLLLFK